MTHSAPATCPHCGTPVASAFLGSICARCLLTGVATEVETHEAFTDAPTRDDPSPSPAPAARQALKGLRIGARFGDYELVDVLGRGGMAVVYLARQVNLDRLVALKTIAAPLVENAPMQERFRREAKAVASLDHPGIVSVHDAGVLHDTLFYTMDFIEGQDLARVLRERRLPVREAAALVRRVAEAIGYAHTRGIVHRDLKPSNVLLDPAGDPHVVDFGLAFEGGDEIGRLTLTGDLLGTPPYMAPEMLTGGAGRAVPATDVYALGAMLFEMLTGRTPFISESSSEIMHLALHEQPPSLRLLNPAVPRDLEIICLKCLEKSPAGRYGNGDEFAADLGRFLGGETIHARPVSAPVRAWRWSRRRPGLATFIVALGLGTVGATWAAVAIDAGRVRALRAETAAREHTRDARLAEARALRRTTLPGRRQQALAALAEAAQVRPGTDLRDEALAALMLYDVKVLERWNLGLGGPARISLDPMGTIAAVEKVSDALGAVREPATLRKWGASEPFAALTVPGGARAVGPMRFSPDGKYFMESFADATLRVWRVGDTEPCLTLSLRPRPGSGQLAVMYNDHYAFTPDNRFVALGLPGRGVALHRLADGGEAARWEDGDVFDKIVVSPDGRYLAAESLDESRSRAVSVLTVPDLKPAGTFTPASAAGLLAWSGDSRVLTVGQNDGSFSLYDVRDGRPLSKITDAQRRSTAVRPLGGDALLAVTTANSMHMLNVVLGREELLFNGVTRTPITAGPAGDVFTMAFNDGTVARMQVETPVGFVTIPPSRAAGYEVMGNTFALDSSPDGRWIATANRNLLVVFDARNGRLVCDLDTGLRTPNDVGSVAFSGDGRFLYHGAAGSSLTRYPLLEQPGGATTLGAGEIIDGEKGFFIADQTADRKRLALLNFATNSVRVVEIADGKLTTVAQWNVSGVYNAAFSPDGEQVIANTNGLGPDAAAQRIRVYRARDGAVVRELDAHISCDVAWSADGRTVLTSNGPSQSLLWDPSDWHVKAKLDGELGGDVTTYAIAPDSSYAVIAHDDRIHLVSTRDGSLLGSFESPGATGLAVGVRFLPDGKRFAILWRDGRIDLVEPDALRRGLADIGLGWTTGK